VEKRVSHWCNRWLTIGGRFTLITYFLEDQPIYRMALAAIPISVSEKLRALTYSSSGQAVRRNIKFTTATVNR
jgi:hypothetical protein